MSEIHKNEAGENRLNHNEAKVLATRPKRRWLRGVGMGLAAAAIFAGGVLVGQGDIKFHRQYAAVTGLPATLDYSSVNQVYQALKDNYDGQLSESQVLNGIKAGIAESTSDPYTEYFTADQAKAFNSALNNSFSGIGAELGKDVHDNLIIVSPIAGFPAAKAGLKAQDMITAINAAPTTNMSLDQAVTKIRGPAGTSVSLTIVRGGKQQVVAITRQNIHLPSVTSKVLPGNIGYIQITTFADDTAALVDQAAARLQNQRVKAVILDLRDNPGGLLSAATSVASQWLQDGKLILQEKHGSTVVDTYNSSGNHRLVGIPTVVLVNGGSASASEITAGALHDNGAARLIGEKTYGKGVVQQILDLNDGSQLKVTVASWYRPNGQNINHKGINPDQTVMQPAADAASASDPQLQAATDWLTAQRR